MNLEQAISLSTLRSGGPGSGRHPEGTAGRKTEDLARSRGWTPAEGKGNSAIHVYTRRPSDFSGDTEELSIGKEGGWLHYNTEGQVAGIGDDVKSLKTHLGAGPSSGGANPPRESWPSDELLGE